MKKLAKWVGVLSLLMMTACEKNEVNIPESQNAKASASRHTKQYSGEVANTWVRLLTDISRTAPLPPPPSIRLFVYSELALYEAVLPGMPSYQSAYTLLTGKTIDIEKKKDYYWPAAANAAVARTASRILKNYNPNPNLTSIIALEKKFQDEFAGLTSPESLERSISFGRTVGDLIYEWSTTDGTLTASGTIAPCPPYVPLGGPGNWVPTPPNFSPAAGACQGKLRTFTPGIIVSSLPAPPPGYSTDPGSAFYAMVKDVVDKTATRTTDDAVLCQSWRDIVGTNYNTPAHVINISARILEKENLNLEDVVAIYAKQSMSIFDAIVAAFDAKFYYVILRPITYIRGVMGNNAWNPLYTTIIHPSYPATMPSAAAAGFRIMEDVLGKNYAFTDSSLSNLYGKRNYSSFDELVGDIGKTRLLSGHNFQPAIDAGITQGNTVAELTSSIPLKKE